MRMAAGSRASAHVDQRADAGFVEDRDELVGAARAVADREDQAAASTALKRKNEGGHFGDPHSVEPAGVDLRGPLYDPRMEDRRAKHRLDVHAGWSVDSNLCSGNPYFGARLQPHARLLHLHDGLQLRQLLLQLGDPNL
jgi:hypothetical protein